MSEQITGFLNVNKPAGITSHDVVARVRRLLRDTTGAKKVGHAGTLDPMATGVLALCIGQATRLSEYAMQSQKQYRAAVHLGVTTDTYDAEGQVIARVEAAGITRQQVEQVLGAFRGTIQQIPPMYSAIKREGKKLYELARAGQEIELDARPVTIEGLRLIDWDTPFFTLDVTCSPGTYIRSLAHDIGQALGVGAHLAALERIRSGGFRVEDAVALDTLLAADDWRDYLIDPRDALPDWQAIRLSPKQAQAVQHGRFIGNDGTLSDEYVMAYTPGGHLLAVLQNRGQQWKPHKVFLTQQIQDD